ncbi:hybrid sensor histidine kinase/response regulator [Desulfotignum phosphitoxidans]|uniref:histidine kinase n=1 Tax=Desulfotignum phosphitoxidans DSM 13687 TaxID=1286635 RepID=S0G2L0_9BACT|nr:PAS domain-containing sensor histidine kinase [Desulfotignum phosphitoxidans]EMS81588.1 two-component system multi-sensor hybrid histidine kinase [Desulfotignum phosphitoxidans DSM 13687]
MVKILIDQLSENIVETIHEPLLVLDSDLKVILANRSFIDSFKVTRKETLGSFVYDLGNGQWDIPRLRELLEKVLPEKNPFDNYEVEHNFAAIGRRIMLLNGRQIEQAAGKGQIILLAIEDITERRQLEMLLADSEKRYRRLFETANDGILLLEKNEGHIAQANPAVTSMLGYSTSEFFGKKLKDVGFPDHMGTIQALLQALEQNGIVHYNDTPIHKKTGEVLYSDIYMVDKADLVQCNIRDATRHRNLEAQLRQAQKMEAVGSLTGGIAHDFNNILNVIIGYGTMVKDRLDPGSPAMENMNEVLTAADRAAELIRKLLVFSRERIVEVKSVNINALIFDLQKMLVRIIKESIEFHLDLANRSLIVRADAGEIEHVLINLATNARDAMREGGRLTISTGLSEMDEESVAAYGYGKPDRYVRITVADTGTGMDAKTQKKIFDPFFTTKDVGKGTGLGLAVSYGIIKQHNGYINVYSEPGQGTVFNIFLPLSEETATGDEKADAAAPVMGGNETVLVAEDETSLRKLIKTVLESSGYCVILAEDGQDAVTKFMENRERINLVMLDMIMPKKSGKEVCEVVRKMDPRMKVLFASGYAMNNITKKEMTKDVFDFIHKPFRPKDLLIKVREILDRQGK